MRIITDLNEASIEALKWLCDNYKISRAEAIRRAVMEKAEAEMEHEQKRTKEDILKSTFGAWKNTDNQETEIEQVETVSAELENSLPPEDVISPREEVSEAA